VTSNPGGSTIGDTESGRLSDELLSGYQRQREDDGRPEDQGLASIERRACGLPAQDPEHDKD
jgi:hypothetical protein